MIKYMGFLVAFWAMLASCDDMDSKRVHGSGNVKTEEHKVGDFKNLDVSSTVDIIVEQGDLKPIRIEGDDNLLSYLEITQDGDKVIIKNRDGFNFHSNHDVKVYVTAPVLNSISLSGAGTISGKNKITNKEDLELNLSGAGKIELELDAPKVVADISGVGSLNLKGNVKDAELELSGVGSAHCFDLLAENTKVTISGVGSAEVFASVKLDAELSSIGSVKYRGNPSTVNKQISGLGSLEKVN